MWKKVTIVFLSALLFGLTIFAVLRLAEKSEGIYSALNREIVQSELEGRKTAVVFFQIASGQTEELKNFESILQQYTQHLANLNDVLRQSQTAVLMACKSYADKAGDLRKKFSAWYAVSSSLNADNETLASIRSDFDQCERLYNVAIEQIQNAELQNDKLDAVVSASIIVITWLLGLFVAVILTRVAVQSAMQRKYFVARQKGAAVLKIHAGQKQPLRAVGKVPAGTFGSNATSSSSVYSSSSGLASAGSSVAETKHRAATFGSNATSGSSVYSSSSGLATAGSSVADATNRAGTFGSNATSSSSVYSSSSGLASEGSSVADAKHGAATFGSNATSSSSVYSSSSGLASASENMQLKAENRNLQQQAEKITTELKTVQAAYSNLLQTNEELKKAHELLQTETQHKLSVSSDKLSEKTDEAKNLITSFTESKNALASTQARISYTEKNITSISEIATMIEDIAEQIKMLSMNAAIEAAHAGESGKGFAVVATEMSKLATATSENSKNISTTVKELIKDITFIARAGGDLEKAFEKLDATTNSVHRFLVDVKKELI